MILLTQDDMFTSRKFVNEITNSADISDIREKLNQLLTDNTEHDIQYLSHVNVLFLNVLLNDLYHRNKSAEERALVARRVISEMITELKTPKKPIGDIEIKHVDISYDTKLIIIKYCGENDPVLAIDEAVKELNQPYTEFVDMNMDNPWVRIVSVGKNNKFIL